MFAFLFVAAAAAPHSVTGAFGYALGQAPPARMAACAQFIAPTGTSIFSCPGKGPFSRIAITTQHHAVTRIDGSRDYKGTPLAVAMRTCLADLAPLARMVRRDYPRLVQVPIYGGGNFWFSEQSSGRVPTGRSIIGHCSETRTQVSGNYVMLSFSYGVSTREDVGLINLDKAERGAK
jgi:hypothetical protein